MPTVTAIEICWAAKIIQHNIEQLIAQFEKGEVGGNNEELRQRDDVIRIIKTYVIADNFESVKKFKVPPEMYKDKVITYRYLSNRTSNLSAFRNDKIGATKALDRTIKHLIDIGKLQEIGKLQMQERYGTAQRAFAPTQDLSILQ